LGEEEEEEEEEVTYSLSVDGYLLLALLQEKGWAIIAQLLIEHFQKLAENISKIHTVSLSIVYLTSSGFYLYDYGAS
jgi:hypothetical protein